MAIGDRPTTSALGPHPWEHLILRQVLLEEGFDDGHIRSMLRSGEWDHVRSGAYLVSHLWRSASEAQRHLIRAGAVVARATADGVLSHTTSVLLNGGDVWGVSLANVHFQRLDGKAGRTTGGVKQHRGVLTDDQIVTTGGLRHTSAARALAESLALPGVDVERGLVMVNSLLSAKACTLAELGDAIAGIGRWPYSKTHHIVGKLADPKVDSLAESRVVATLWNHRLPKPELQVKVWDQDTGEYLGRVDFLLRKYGIWIEFDGMVKYGKHVPPGKTVAEVVIQEKLREDKIRAATGWICIRITWNDLENPERFIRKIRKHIERARAAGL